MRNLILPKLGVSWAALIVFSSAVQLCWSLRARISDLIRIDDDVDNVDILERGFGSGRSQH